MKRTVVMLVAAVGCGGGKSGPDASGSNVPPTFDAPNPPAGRYEPWHIGAVWSYKLTDPTGVMPPATDKKTTIVGWQTMPATAGPHAGHPAYYLHIEQMAGTVDVWESFEGDVDVRYAQIDYDMNGALVDTQYETPYRLKLDESAAHIAANATFSENFTETTTDSTGMKTNPKTETWTVVNPAEQVTVIAGSYTALHVQRVNSFGTTAKTKDYWFVKDVGKIKETGGSQNEELMSYTP